MKLIFSVDAIFMPLTGIGRYAWELAQRFETHSQIDDLRFLAMGQWVSSLEKRLIEPTMKPYSAKTQPGSIFLRLRRNLSKHAWAVQAYNAVIPALMAYRLRDAGDFLYHSPNYFIPAFEGKTVATIHDLSIYKYPQTHPKARRKLFDLQMPDTLDRVDHIITNSNAMRQEVLEFFNWPEDRISAIHLGVNQNYRQREAETLGPILSRYNLTAKHYSLCVSTLEPRKGIESLLRAYEILPGRLRRRYPLVLAGDEGWLNDEIVEQIDRGKRAGWVRYLGYVPDEDLPILYAGARIFCYPSLYEGFGLPILEAMASGVPVLTSNRSSMLEVAGGAAWLVEPDDIDSLNHGLCKTLTDATWRGEAIKRGLAVAAHYSWDLCVENTIAVYKQVLAC